MELMELMELMKFNQTKVDQENTQGYITSF
jgi:hypothetical protein